MFKNDPKAIDELFTMCEENGIEMVDVKFVNPLGQWHHISLAMESFTRDAFEGGVPFDGSSIPLFQEIVESDLVMIPDATTAYIDPFCDRPTVSLIAEPMDPVSGDLKEYDNNARYVARKALKYMEDEGIADEMFVGPEVEFHIFDDVQYGSQGNYSMYRVDSDEGNWNNENSYDMMGNHGNRAPHQGGYFAMAPIDQTKNIRGEMTAEMQNAGIVVERHHHEVGNTGQQEINIKYAGMLQQADQVMMYKYIVRNVAARYGKTATFMPKPIFGENGNGMHAHQSLWKNGEPLFYDKDGYAGFSEMGLHYIGGLLKHANAVLAFGAPATNSYRRLTPGYEAPVVRAYSSRNRSAAIRIPVYHASNPAAKRLEFRSGDPMANPYMFFSAMLMAGLDGIKNKIDPGKSEDRDLFELSPEEEKSVEFVPSSLEEALEALEKDHDFLLEGGVFTKDYIERYIAYKRDNEADAIRLRPHPAEFDLYYNQ